MNLFRETQSLICLYVLFAFLGPHVESYYIPRILDDPWELELAYNDTAQVGLKEPPELALAYNDTAHVGLKEPSELALAYNDTAHERMDNIDERGSYYGGDMRLTDEQLTENKQGIVGQNYRWPKGKIPYQLDPALQNNERKIVLGAMHEIEGKTCIKFHQRKDEEAYILIVRGGPNTGCNSPVGLQKNQPQKVNLQAGNPGCFDMGIVAHELVHIIGYFHEQSRSDRDDHVNVNWPNIQSGMSYNFDKYSSNLINPYGSPYDFGSIMHYSAYAFSTNNEPTLLPKDNTPLNVLGQRRGLSPHDAKKIDAMYEGIC